MDTQSGTKLKNYIEGANQYTIIAIATQDEPGRYFDSVAGDAVKLIGGTRTSLDWRSSYAVLGFKGPWSVSWISEVYNIKGQGPSVITKTIKLPPGIRFFFN